MQSFDTVGEVIGRCAAGLPVALFHKIADPRPEASLKEYYVTPGVYRDWVAGLASAGFRTVNFSQLVSFAASPPVRKIKELVISFDDGYLGALEHAAIPLREHGFSAIQFIVSDLIGKRNDWDLGVDTTLEPLMDEAQIREWLALGHEIGAHTCTHPNLTTLKPPQVREEIVASKKKLEDRFQIPIRHFAYPYGGYTGPIAEMVAEAGYETACTTDVGVVTARSKPFKLERLYFIEKRHQPARP